MPLLRCGSPLLIQDLAQFSESLLDKAIVLWDDGEQSEERLKDLIIAGYDESKIVKKSEYGHQGTKITLDNNWWGSAINLEEDISSELALNDRLIINQMLLSGIPLTIDKVKGLKWGNFINEGFAQGS